MTAITPQIYQMFRQSETTALRPRQRVGKYRIECKLAQGGFANVYQALDTIEGVRVALKMPLPNSVTPRMLESFQREVRLVAKLDHPNILPLKDASFIDGRFVIASRLGEKSLADRLHFRLSTLNAINLTEQMLEAVAYAHRQNIIHCDIKPENMILHSDGRLQLTDFGIARVASKTIHASGSGTVGYMAPEQAMGRPSTKSDVFSLGLIIYRMLAGHLPEWPFDWAPPGYATLRRKAHPDLIHFIRKSLDVRPSKRFRDGNAMLNAFRRIKVRSIRYASRNHQKPIHAQTKLAA